MGDNNSLSPGYSISGDTLFRETGTPSVPSAVGHKIMVRDIKIFISVKTCKVRCPLFSGLSSDMIGPWK